MTEKATHDAAPGTDPTVGYWDRVASRYDGSMRLLGRPMPRMLALVAETLRGAEDVLEVAAGTGLVTLAIARVAGHVTATDSAPAMIARLRGRLAEEGITNVSTSVADLHEATNSGPHDAVVAANVLHLVPDLPSALRALASAVRPGGVLVLPTFCHAETWGSRVLSRVLALTGFPGRRRMSSASFRASCEAAGLRVRREEVIPGPIPIAFLVCESASSAASAA